MLQIDSVQPPLKFVPPIFNPIVFPVLKILGPLWMKRNASVDGVTIDNPEPLVDLFRSFYAKKSRFIL
ncbi:MAG: 1-acyl-sn-glycerol-3-phosphate acyltransferase, partial [Cyanobacteria bacterium P01_G01_bin.4]